MSTLWEEMEALRHDEDPSPSTARAERRKAKQQTLEAPIETATEPAPRKASPSIGEDLIKGMAVSALVLSLALAFGFDPVSRGGAVEASTGETLAAASAPPVTAPQTAPPTIPAPAPAPAPEAQAEVATSPTTAAPPPATTSTTLRATTTTTRPATTTTTARPAPIGPASATASGTGVTLTLDIGPTGEVRAVDGRLSANMSDGRVLYSVLVDFGDGAVLPGSVSPWACNDPAAPNPHTLPLPGHTYRAPGTYQVTVAVSTAKCIPTDDDWGPRESAEVTVQIVVP
ncbi:MAG TPA: PKD domain-containing protein [Acidimicrobiia bacterium]|nr:PKD domain-containing protein [Acidimicrobiia bacterium]